MISAGQRAAALLERLRQTPMRRGVMASDRHRRRKAIARVLESQHVPAALARRISFQLAFKFDAADLAGRADWMALAHILQEEIGQLKQHVGLEERQIVEVLPKMSAADVEAFFQELRRIDRTIARTILNAAVETAEPLAAGRRFIREYQAIARQFQSVDPSVARTLANATFAAHAPKKQAMELFGRFAEAMKELGGDPAFARTVAKATLRAPHPLEAVRAFVDRYRQAMTDLIAVGVDEPTARMMAKLKGVQGFRATARAHELTTHADSA